MVARACAFAAALMALALPGAARAQGILSQMQDEVASIVSRARPAIVSIEDERALGGRGRQDAPKPTGPDVGGPNHRAPESGGKGDHHGMPEPPKIGSGFSIGDGFIVTTADVLSGMKNPLVMTEDGRRIHATVSGIDPEMNIGVLKLAAGMEIPGLKLGHSSSVYPGHFAISIGNQYGHLNSVALNLIAGVRDDGFPAGEHFYPSVIQIAGTVGVGTSGAPILDVHGEVVGMVAGIPFGDWTYAPFPNGPRRPESGRRNSAVVNTVGAGPGQGKPEPAPGATADQKIVFLRPPVTSAGFALPVDDMRPVLAGLRQGKLVHCWLGLDMDPVRKREDANGTVTTTWSVIVTTVYPNSPASAAGLQTGDKLLTVNGRQVVRLNSIRAALLRAQPGEPMEIRLERKGAPQTVTVKLAARPDKR